MRRTRLETSIAWLRRSSEILKFIKEIKKKLEGENLTFLNFKELSEVKTWHCMSMLKLISKDNNCF